MKRLQHPYLTKEFQKVDQHLQPVCVTCEEKLRGMQRRYCSLKCNQAYHKSLRSLAGKETDCEICGNTFVIQKNRSRRFCSKHCAKQNTYNNNKNELSTWGVESDYNFKDTHGTYACSYDEHHIDPTILALAEAVEEYGINQHNAYFNIMKFFGRHRTGKYKNPVRKTLNNFK
tara:strand:- start:27 stop:545 length:519 start_codon:yes stop_codon:yes gene_type:complete